MTIKELSAELKVSEQAIRQWCKKNNVRKESTKARKASYIIDCDTEKQLRAYYSDRESNESNERKASTNSKQGKESNETFLSQLEKLAAQLEDSQKLNAQLTAQIEELRTDKLYLRGLVDKLTAQLDSVTTALKAAQALHGMERQQQAIEVKPEAAAAEQEQRQRPKRTVPRSEQRRKPQQAKKQPSVLMTVRNFFKK